MAHVVNPLTAWAGGPLLTVRGRRSGRPIRTVVPPFELNGSRYLVAGHGETHWVRNLRAAAGEAEYRLGGRTEKVRAREILGTDRDEVVAAYRRRMGWRGKSLFAALPDSADHPVFRLDPTI
jgi:deazaflavin-dependent oxidoreductase (nitroreductase family)